ncbi:MAG TPA: TIM barrel protein [Verrucomicrobiae bacterium]|jgi:sugar phosphate isomerase/epimerase|nr:TIM barrel protein [Verrucomicrobiae bacterium]
MKLLKLFAAALLLAVAGVGAADLPAEYYAGLFPVGCQAYMFHRFTAFEAIEKTAAAGGKIIEFYPGQRFSPAEPELKLDQNLSDEAIAKLQAKLRESHVLAVSFGVVEIPRDEAGARKIFEFARKLGLRAITAEPAMEQMDMLEKLVKEYDIKLGIHNHPRRASEPDYKVWDPAYVFKMVNGRDARLGATADIGHWTRSGLDAVAALKLLNGRIISCHLKDVKEVGNPDAGDLPLGYGVSNVKGVLQDLRREKFKGYIFIEYERDWENSVPDIAQCVGYVHGFGDAPESLNHEKNSKHARRPQP